MQHVRDMYDFKNHRDNIYWAKRLNRYPKPPVSDKLQLVHFAGGFIVLGCGFTLALVIIIVEHAASVRTPCSAGPYVTKKGNGSIYLPKAILLFKSTHQGLI